MGGNALSRTSVRLGRTDYERVAANCVSKLRALYPGKRVEALGSYRTKTDFGDCDILIDGTAPYEPARAAAALGAVEVVCNGPVTSVGVRVCHGTAHGGVFQVDLIATQPQAFDFALSYFGHGDAGNLLGRLYHACGLALRHDGLFYYVRDAAGGHKLREIALTRRFDDALAFFEYDTAVYARGFDTLEDIFRYVASSPFFNAELFLLSNRNAKSRARDRKRAMYMQFLDFCRTHPGLAAYPYPQDKSAWLPRIAAFYPHFQAAHDDALAERALLHAANQKFNGNRVSQLTGLQGKDLGELMQRFRASFATPQAMREFILTSDEATLASRVMGLAAAAQGAAPA
jgi:hypothetical protein